MRSLCREARAAVFFVLFLFFVFFFFFFFFFSINVLSNSHFLFFNSWSSGKMNMTERLCPKATGKIRFDCENVFETLV